MPKPAINTRPNTRPHPRPVQEEMFPKKPAGRSASPATPATPKPEFVPKKSAANAPKPPSPEPPDSDEEEEVKAGRQASAMPLTSVIDDQPTMTLASELLAEAEEVKARHDADEKRLKDIRSELAQISEAFGLPGLRYGHMALLFMGEKTKKTLDKRKLIENGVSPEIIQDSYTESKPFTASRLVLLKR